MTAVKTKRAKALSPSLGIGIFTVFLVLLLFYASEIKTAIEGAIRLSVIILAPSLFPYIILSDYLLSIEPNENSRAAKFFSRILGIPPSAIPIVISGLMCGFPLGARGARALYEDGGIDEKNLLRISSCCNNPSVGFAVSAVGIGMRGCFTDGCLLYITVTLSSLTLLMFTRRNSKNHNNTTFITRQKFDLRSSITNASSVLILVSSYVIFFSTAV